MSLDGALCAETVDSPGNDIWFDESRRTRDKSTDTALALCEQCPVRDACLAYALEHEIDDGIWGGKTPGQRTKRAACAEKAGTSAGVNRHRRVRQPMCDACLAFRRAQDAAREAKTSA